MSGMSYQVEGNGKQVALLVNIFNVSDQGDAEHNSKEQTYIKMKSF